ncbi:MAG: hypothetical protein ACJ75G_01640 [Gaiellaceae bacterium]
MAGRSTKLLVLVGLALAAGASSGSAASPHRPLGVVPHAGAAHARSESRAFSTAGLLTFDANYESLIDQYFTDVAAASGSDTNVYSIATQYYDGSGPIQYQATFGGAYVDTAPLPANGCDDGADLVCLTDVQLQTEIQNVLSAKGWSGGTSALFVLLTPNGVGSCFDSSAAECTTNVYCAYHNSFVDSNGEPVIYANEPYDATIAGCESGSSPNSDDADTELNTISHEHNEAITDPFGDAWYAADGAENGDLCAWTFGTPLGTVGDQPHNQAINGHDYWLQEEYSNEGKGCFQMSTSGPPTGNVLAYHGGEVMHTNTTFAIYWLPTPGNSVHPVVTGTAAVNHTLASSNGSWNGSPTGYSYQWQRCSSSGAGCVDIPGATGSTYALTSADGAQYVRATVSAANLNGASAYAASDGQLVIPLPAASGVPLLSGRAAVGKQLRTSNGTWNTQAAFTYRWRRCAADGTRCTSIPGATAPAHVAIAADAGHRLEAVVTATNLSGTAQTLSKTSGVVVAVPRVRKGPRISGPARLGRRLSAEQGLWSGPPKSYRYRWLRCNMNGGSCVPVRRATHPTYRVTHHDAGHRLRVRVTATNAAGSRMATSRPTGLVPAGR